jgi:hypothetical protein
VVPLLSLSHTPLRGELKIKHSAFEPQRGEIFIETQGDNPN